MYKQKLLPLLAVIILFAACKPETPKSGKTPEVYTATFETLRGDFEIEVTRAWAPIAADRFYQLVNSGFYDGEPAYRVVEGFVAQFGSIDGAKMKPWKQKIMPDEPLLQKNKKGFVSFARQGKESRSTDVFINLKDNGSLDTLMVDGLRGYTPFGRVTDGMETVEGLYSGYGEMVMQHPEMFTSKSKFIKAFPSLDYIEKAYISSGE